MKDAKSAVDLLRSLDIAAAGGAQSIEARGNGYDPRATKLSARVEAHLFRVGISP
jgi:hypothetical protein